MKRLLKSILCVTTFLMWAISTHATEAFDTCPTKAFLIQGETAVVYGVKIVTGNYSELSNDLGMPGKLNGAGFSVHDNYLYGFGYNAQDLVKLGKDFQMQPLGVTGLPSTNFYVGDAAVIENAYYLYRRGADYGLYRVSLAPQDNDYLQATRVVNGNSLNLNIYDLAFHPSSGEAYAVEADGDLHKIDVAAGTSTLEGNLGVTGTFGASYFDVEGNLYISRNSDGHIFRIKVDDIGSEPTAADFDPAVTGTTYSYYNYPNNTNVNGTSANDVLYIENNMSGNGFNYNGNGGYDRLLLGNAQSYYQVVSQGTGAYRVTWPNGKYLNLNGVEEISYSNATIEAADALQLFALGPSSGNNDGARCATAPLIDEDEEEESQIDFGDAPDSYNSSLANNGPRHEMGTLYLGATITGENDSKMNDSGDDGVAFISAVETANDAELQSIVSVNASEPGYLHGWVDWDQNGSFDSDEKVFDGRQVVAGDNTLLMSSQPSAATGTTWARFRLSDKATLGVTGGVNNGEVEDYEISVGDSQYTTVCYPSSTSYVTLAYEDLWPRLGDYDFNDVVVQYRACQDKLDDEIKRYWITGNLIAVGAAYHNAFAVRLEGVSPANINTGFISHRIGNEYQSISPVESGRTEAILTVLPDTAELFEAQSPCKFFRTENNCFAPEIIPFSLYVPLITGIDAANAPSGVLDPFIYAVDGYNHGQDVSSQNERGWEVHLKNQSPTEAFNTQLYGVGMDASSAASGLYFTTSKGLPFAIQVSDSWQPPREKIDITDAYSQFADFAESNGLENSLWFMQPTSGKVIPVE